MDDDSKILQDIVDFLNTGDSPTRTLATKHNVRSLIVNLAEEYREMEQTIINNYQRFGMLEI